MVGYEMDSDLSTGNGEPWKGGAVCAFVSDLWDSKCRGQKAGRQREQ